MTYSISKLGKFHIKRETNSNQCWFFTRLYSHAKPFRYKFVFYMLLKHDFEVIVFLNRNNNSKILPLSPIEAAFLFPCTLQIYIFFFCTLQFDLCLSKKTQCLPISFTHTKISTRGALSAYILCLDRHAVTVAPLLTNSSGNTASCSHCSVFHKSHIGFMVWF